MSNGSDTDRWGNDQGVRRPIMGPPGHQRRRNPIRADSIDTLRGRASNLPNVQPPSDLPGVQDPLRRPQRGLSGRGAENRPSVIGAEGQKMPNRRTSGMIPESLRMSDVGEGQGQAGMQGGQSGPGQVNQLMGMISDTFDSMVGDPQAASAFAAMLARVGGEGGGRFTDQDISRAMQMIPNAQDPPEVVLQKKQALLQMVEQGASQFMQTQGREQEMNQIRQMMDQPAGIRSLAGLDPMLSGFGNAVGGQLTESDVRGAERKLPQRRGPAPVGYANPRTR